MMLTETNALMLTSSQRNILKFAAQSEQLSLRSKAHVLGLLLTNEGLKDQQIANELSLDISELQDQQSSFVKNPKAYILEIFSKASLLSAVSYLLAAA